MQFIIYNRSDCSLILI